MILTTTQAAELATGIAAGAEVTRCCFCGDDIENHTHNVQYPGGINRWLCGTCIRYADVTLHLEHLESLRSAQVTEAAETEAKAAELATGIDEVDL